ncbi:MAG: hypothetical protein PHO10_03505 [Gemmiger sp.]|nr:hypothetical protein [Gemmiger sp.]
MNGIFVQTEYHGRLIRKIVCGSEVRWFIGSNCAVTYATMAECEQMIDHALQPKQAALSL